MKDWLRLVRAPLAPTAAWDTLAATALALAGAGRALADLAPGAWALLGLTALLVYAFGMALNDLADRERDRTLAPHRPLPSGRIGPRAAGALVILLAAGAAVLGGGPAGSRPAVLLALGLAALYDLAAKRALVLGAATMGLVRAANASVGALPLVLAGSAPASVLLGPLAVGLYSAAVTVWSTTEEGDRPARRLAARLLALVAFALAGLAPWLVTGTPTLGLAVAFGAVTSLAFARTPRAATPQRQVLEMLLGLYFLSACVATGAEGGSPETGIGALAVAFALIYVSQRSVRALRPAARAA